MTGLFAKSHDHGIHKAIVDRDVWERAQEIVKSNQPYDRSGGAAEMIVPLRGILRCVTAEER